VQNKNNFVPCPASCHRSTGRDEFFKPCKLEQQLLRSSASKRQFSTATWTLNERRTNLQPDKLLTSIQKINYVFFFSYSFIICYIHLLRLPFGDIHGFYYCKNGFK
jgi:hypothetical protein